MATPRGAEGKAAEDWTALYRASVELAKPLDALLMDVVGAHAAAFPEPEGKRGEMGSSTDCEFTLEQSAAHEEYVQQSERLLGDFLRRHGVDKREFYRECRETVDGAYCALFQEDINAWFVDMLLAISDFERFHAVATRMAREPSRGRHKRK